MTLFLTMILMAGAAGILQALFPPIGVLGYVKVPFLLAVVLYYALHHDTFATLSAALVAGILQDVLSPLMPLGYSVFCFSCVGLAAARFRSIVVARAVVVPVLFGGAGAACVSIILWILLTRDEQVAWGFGWVLWKTAGYAFLGAVVTPLVFGPARALNRLIGNEELEGEVDEVE